MGTDPTRDDFRARTDVMERLLARVLSDLDGDGLQTVDRYKELFPGQEALVERGFRIIRESVDGELPATYGSEDGTRRIAHYVLLRELGRGGQGTVFLARDERLDREVALKVLHRTDLVSSAARLRFEREAQAASQLDHPNICTVYEYGEEGGVAYIAMRLVQGETLDRRIRGLRVPDEDSFTVQLHEATTDAGPHAQVANEELAGGSRPPRGEEILELTAMVEKVARALHVAHEAGLVHRDMKPGNIIITAEGEPVILDFGLVREIESEALTLTETGQVLGTPAYMSPEQLVGGRVPIDARTDVYSLGVILYECLTGERPFNAPTSAQLYQQILSREAPDPRRLNPAVSADMRAVLETALDKDSARRYATAFDLAEDLRRVRVGEPVAARAAGPLARVTRWCQRNPGAAAGLGAAGVVFIGVACLFTWAIASRDKADAEQRLRELQAKQLVESEEKRRRLAMAERDRLFREQLLQARLIVDAGSSAPGIAEAFREFGIDLEAVDVLAAARTRLGELGRRDPSLLRYALDQLYSHVAGAPGSFLGFLDTGVVNACRILDELEADPWRRQAWRRFRQVPSGLAERIRFLEHIAPEVPGEAVTWIVRLLEHSPWHFREGLASTQDLFDRIQQIGVMCRPLIETIDRALEEHPRDMELHATRMRLALALGDAETALREAAVVRTTCDHASGARCMARALLLGGDIDATLRWARRAVEADRAAYTSAIVAGTWTVMFSNLIVRSGRSNVDLATLGDVIINTDGIDAQLVPLREFLDAAGDDAIVLAILIDGPTGNVDAAYEKLAATTNDRLSLDVIYADSLIKRGALRKTLEIYDRLLEQHPEVVYLHWTRARILSEVESLTAGAAALERSIAAIPGSLALKLALLDFHRALRTDQEASRRLVADMVRSHPDEPTLLEVHGDFQARSGDRTAARASWERSARADPARARPYLLIAYDHATHGELENAVRCCRQALVIEPRNDTALAQLPFLHAQLGNTDGAIRAAEAYKANAPGNLWALTIRLALDAAYRGMTGDLEPLQDYLQWFPSSVDGWRTLAGLRLGRHEAREAAEAARRGLSAMPSMKQAASLHAQLARAMIMEGNGDAGLQHAREAAERNPDYKRLLSTIMSIRTYADLVSGRRRPRSKIDHLIISRAAVLRGETARAALAFQAAMVAGVDPFSDGDIGKDLDDDLRDAIRAAAEAAVGHGFVHSSEPGGALSERHRLTDTLGADEREQFAKLALDWLEADMGRRRRAIARSGGESRRRGFIGHLDSLLVARKVGRLRAPPADAPWRSRALAFFEGVREEWRRLKSE